MNFEVCDNVDLFSDHLPIKIEFKNFSLKTELKSKELDYSRANWTKFKNLLDEVKIDDILINDDVEMINEFLVKNINKAASDSIPWKKPNKHFHIKIPEYLRKLIKHKKYLLKHKSDINSITNVNILSKIIKEEISVLRNNNWNSFTENIKNNPLSSKKFWRRIETIKNDGRIKNNCFPKLFHNDLEYNTDIEKANLFARILNETFKDNENDKYDKLFKTNVENEMSNYFNQEQDLSSNKELVNLESISKILKNLKTTLSCGEDQISNIMLKNVGINIKKVIVHLFNISINTGKVPSRWKKVIVKMIPKSANSRKNPLNYRPISLTNCMSRLCERVILIRIQEHLKKNNILVKEQSGFRSHRQTKDNLFNLCQRNFEAFNRKMKNCVVFFDISKAFDKVWHSGLLFKLKNHKFDKYLIVWVAEFLRGRNFKVKINEKSSDAFEIEVGVPQGGVLSPVLFSIYINDIIFDKTQIKKTKTESTLFADDLATSCASNKIEIIEKLFKLYMNKLENWLLKWRLSINPSKCQYILFSRGKNAEVNIELFAQKIPGSDSIKFLGLTFDRSMTFSKCVENIKDKCSKRLNILKILSHSSWKLTESTLCNIYLSLSRSIIDYASIIFDLLCETRKKELRAIQYHALRVAFRRPFKCSHSDLLALSKVATIDERCRQLNVNYFENAIKFENKLVTDITAHYLNWFPDSFNPKFKTILCNYRDTIQKPFP